MRRHTFPRQYTIIGVLLCIVILSLGSIDDPPNGYTGAPGDDLCTECHTLNNGMQNGSIIFTGFPATIIANQTYTLTITVSNPNGIADLAGFQTVILNESNQNAGTMSNPSPGSAIQTTSGRTYHEHSPAQPFGMPNAVAWTVNWTAPIGSGQISYYSAANIANGNNNDSGDLIVTKTGSGTLFTPLQVAITDVEHVSCFGEMDGSITATASFGQPGYSYQWSNGSSGATISGLGPGGYTVTVTDSDGETATANAIVNQPPVFEIVSTTIDNVTCNGGNDGFIIIELDGGVPPYSGAQGDILTLSNLSAGDHPVNITDANGCLISEEYIITEPPALTIEISVIIEPECFGESTGLISVEADGGTGNLNYDWSNGDNGSTIQNLDAGVYGLTVTDGNGCTAAEIVFLDEPDLLILDLVFLQHVSCAGEADGEIIVDGSGGIGELNYEWSNGDSSPAINGLDPGDYSVTVSDDNGCSDQANYIITEPIALSSSVVGTMSVECFDDATGTLQAQGISGAPPYAYLWSNGATEALLTSLPAATYTVTVTDANACTSVSATTITQPSQLIPNATSTGESAPGQMDGTASAAPTEGTGEYAYMWSNGETTATITGLAVGTYSVTITDDNGCTAMQTVAVSGVNCTLAATVMTTDALCAGEGSGTAQVNATGALGPLTILWSTGDTTQLIVNLSAGMYDVTVIDTAGCLTVIDFSIAEPSMLQSICTAMGETMEGANDGMINCTVSGGVMPYRYLWSNGDTTSIITGLAPGTYHVVVTDDNGCMLSDSVVVNSFACMLSLVVTVDEPDCFGENTGLASVTVNGGTAPFDITWSDGSTGMNADSLVAGAYDITVADADACVSTIMFNVSQPDPIDVAIDTVINASQGGGGEIQISISGGTPPYTTIWTRNGGLVSTSEDIADLGPGDYLLEILDANDCVLTETLVVSVSSGVIEDGRQIIATIYPNPVSDVLSLTIDTQEYIRHGRILSADGRQIALLEISSMHGIRRIDVANIGKGVYYLQLIGHQHQELIPFVKL